MCLKETNGMFTTESYGYCYRTFPPLEAYLLKAQKRCIQSVIGC